MSIFVFSRRVLNIVEKPASGYWQNYRKKIAKKLRSEAKAIGMLFLYVILVSNDFSINQADIFPFLKGVTPLNMSER